MDHRISKDMISSGMTPSGEKTQTDLGKTQYGSAPSPNKLMDAYHSMYQNQKEETLDEMIGKAKASKFNYGNEGITPRPAKRRKQTKSLDQVKADNEARKQRQRESSARTRQQERDIADDIRADTEYQLEFDRIKNSPEAKKFERDKFRAGQRKFKGNYGENVDLLAAYQSIYADTFEEGKIPAGLQAYLDKKKGKKKDDDNGDEEKEGKKKDKKDVKEGAGLYANIHAKRKRGGKMRKKGAKGAPSSQDFANAAKTAKEDIDLFDVISTKLIEEGYSEKESYEIMLNLTEDQLQSEDFGISAALALGAKLAAGAAKAGAVAGKVGAAAAKGAAVAGKAAGKGIAIAGKAAGKGIASAIPKSVKSAASGFKKGLMTKPTQMTKVTTSGGKTVDAANKITPLSQRVGQGTRKTLATMKNNPMNTYLGYSALSSTMQPSAPKPEKASVVKAHADLFDIVKGQLLDEGLNEKEVTDVMTTLTLEEINEVIQINEISAALLKRASQAAEVARGKAAVAGNTELAKKKLAQGQKFSSAMKQKNLATSRAENMRKPTGPMANRPQPDPTKPYPGTPR